MSPQSATRLALALALIACGLSAWAVLRPLPEPPPCTCAEATPARMTRPDRELPPLPPLGDAPEVRTARRSDPAQPPTAPMGERPKAVPPPKYVRFQKVPPSLRIEPGAGDAVKVTNADSALTGKIFLIQAKTEDGELEQISIVAPPPAD